jgi:hypothetical protein
MTFGEILFFTRNISSVLFLRHSVRNSIIAGKISPGLLKFNEKQNKNIANGKFLDHSTIILRNNRKLIHFSVTSVTAVIM